jgi:hypothetical protein
MDNYVTHKNKRSTEASLIFRKGILVPEQGEHPREGRGGICINNSVIPNN